MHFLCLSVIMYTVLQSVPNLFILFILICITDRQYGTFCPSLFIFFRSGVEACKITTKSYNIFILFTDIFTSTRRFCFHFVRLFVSNIMQKLFHRFSQNSVEKRHMDNKETIKLWW